MFESTTIAVVIDPEIDNRAVVEKAIAMSLVSRAKLEFIYSEYAHYLEDGYFYDPVVAKTLREEHSEVNAKKADALAQLVRYAGLSVNVVALLGKSCTQVLVERIAATQPSLVIKSTSHHNRLARIFLANEDWELLRHCPVPLLLVKGLPWSEPPMFVAAVDLDHLRDKPESLDQKLVVHMLELRDRFGGEAHLYH